MPEIDVSGCKKDVWHRLSCLAYCFIDMMFHHFTWQPSASKLAKRFCYPLFSSMFHVYSSSTATSPVPKSLFCQFFSLRPKPCWNRQDQQCQQQPAAPRRALRGPRDRRRRRRRRRRRGARQEPSGFGAATRGQGHAQHGIQRGQQTTKAEAANGEVGMQNIWKWSFRKPRFWWCGFGWWLP